MVAGRHLPGATAPYQGSIRTLAPQQRLGDTSERSEAIEQVTNGADRRRGAACCAAGARRLEFSLDDVTEIIAMRDRREAPCRVMLDKLVQKAGEIADRIVELQRLEQELRHLHVLGQTFPTDDVDGKACVCHLVSEQSEVTVNR